MGIEFEFFQAMSGDSIYINTDKTSILIDGGFISTYNYHIFKKISLPEKKLDLVVLTHNDRDHIEGLIKLINEEKNKLLNRKNYVSFIKEIWFNSLSFNDCKISKLKKGNATSRGQQIDFTALMMDKDTPIPYRETVSLEVDMFQESVWINDDIELILLSPNQEKLDELLDSKDYEGYSEELKKKTTTKNKEQYFSNDFDECMIELGNKFFEKKDVSDPRKPNGSSIAFILIYDHKKYLFLGDAHIELIVDSLEKLRDKNIHFKDNKKIEFEFVKLSHHGSVNNLSKPFLDLIETKNFVILTNGAGNHHHPDKETLSKIIMNLKRQEDDYLNFIFNYPCMLNHNNFSFDEMSEEKFNLIYSTQYPLKNAIFKKNDEPTKKYLKKEKCYESE